MRFVSRQKKIVYTVRRADYKTEGGIKQIVHGLRAEFRNHQFDSEFEATRMGWTDSDREAIEQYLMKHPRFGKTLWLEDARGLKKAKAQAKADRTIDPDTPITRCIATVAVQGESQLCGQPVVGNSDLCAEHQRVAAAVAASPTSME